MPEIIILGLFFGVMPFMAIWLFSWYWIIRIVIPIGLLTWYAFYELEHATGSGVGVVIVGAILIFVLTGLGSGIVVKAIVDFIRWDNSNLKHD